ncbi:hypothetical protein CO731_01954 [Aminobacter sp. MSH1]|nr:hypothetical protein CO731_01954 [Aminobacter sp. MSH1]MDR7225136.1 hypothetical protein [Aminobacter aminovorans]
MIPRRTLRPAAKEFRPYWFSLGRVGSEAPASVATFLSVVAAAPSRCITVIAARRNSCRLMSLSFESFWGYLCQTAI